MMLTISITILLTAIAMLGLHFHFSRSGPDAPKNITSQCSEKHPTLSKANTCVLSKGHVGLHKTAEGRVWGWL